MVTGLVLCGGKSLRMRHDKAFLEVGGKPLLQLQIERLEAAGCAEVLISGPLKRGYERFGKRVVEDHVPDAGPLAGLCAGLSAAQGMHVLTVAVDLSHLKVEFLHWLIQEAGERDLLCPKSENGFEPLCAVYSCSICLPIMKQRLKTKHLSLQQLVKELQEQGNTRVVLPEEWKVWGMDLFQNWNEPSAVDR